MKKFHLFEKSHAAEYLHITEESITTEQICQLLWTEKETFLRKTADFQLEDLCYSQYYWLLAYRQQSGGYDAGTEQQLFQTIEYMYQFFEVDCSILEELESMFA